MIRKDALRRLVVHVPIYGEFGWKRFGRLGFVTKSDSLLIIYIAGYGRSGSTLLDVLLSNLGSLVSLGEAGRLPHAIDVVRLGCSCGRSYQECPIWGPVYKKVGQERVRRGKSLSRLFESLIAPFCSKRREKEYCNLWRDILRVRCPRNTSPIFVDSSKTAYDYAFRPKALSGCAHIEVYVIHLVRPLIDVLKSRKRGKNIELATGRRQILSRVFWRSRAVTGWLFANGVATYLGRLKSIGGYRVVRFEDMVANPDGVGKHILRWVECQSGRRISVKDTTPAALNVSHLVEGNRFAKSGAVEIKK